MIEKILGKVCVTPRGEYVPGETYEKLDIVSYQGSSYIAKKYSKNLNPADNGEHWLCLVKSGVSSWSDLVGKPDLNLYVEKETGKGLFSGRYEDLIGIPDLDLSLFKLVDALPTGDDIDPDKVYLLKDVEQSTEDLDVYSQYKYVDDAWSALGTYKTSIDLSGYVEKETGKGLSTNDYTTAEKTKLESLSNYNDTEVRSLIGQKQSTLTESQIDNTNDVTDDAARFLWGGDWRLPTYEEINALFGKIDSGQWSYTKDMSVQSGGTFSCGYAKISGNNQSIILPTTSRNGSTQDSDHFFYVSSTLNENNNKTYKSRATYHRDWKNDPKNFANDWYPNHDRYVGLAIRPVLDKGGNANGHTAVDLGLSVLWADRNLGASEPKAVGSKFAWGEVKPKETYTWGNYRYYDQINSTDEQPKFTRYVTNENYGIKDNLIRLTIASFYTKEEAESRFSLKNHTHETYVEKETGKGLSANDYDNTAKAKVDAIPEDPKYTDTVYNDTEVRGLIDKKQDKLTGSQIINTNDVTDDAARFSWGGGWRMPTYEEIAELWNLSWSNRVLYDTGGGDESGYTTISGNSNSIILPTTSGREFRYGSSTLYTEKNTECWTKNAYWQTNNSWAKYNAMLGRYSRLGIRPVLDKGADANGHTAVDLGLSVLWADRNLGASDPHLRGDGFAWGEVEPKDVFTWDNYKYNDAEKSTVTNRKYTRYVTDETYGIKDGLTKLTIASFYTKEESNREYALNKNTKALVIEYEDGTTETINIVIKP